MPDWQVWAILAALGPVACMGGGLLGVLTGRWLRFPGAAAVMVVVVVAIDMVGQMPVTYDATLRAAAVGAVGDVPLGDASPTAPRSCSPATPASTWSTCSACAPPPRSVAIWHDRAARTARLRMAIAGVVIVGLAALALAMTTGNADNHASTPIPYKIGK